MPAIDLGEPLPLNKVFIAVAATRPALAIVVLFNGLAWADVFGEVENNVIKPVAAAKILKPFLGNILNTFLSLFPLS